MNWSLASEWIERLERYQLLYVGFSGGVDSTVLLHVLQSISSLRPNIRAVHVHHGLSIQADRWADHCKHICDLVGIPFECHYVRLKTQSNIEAQARDARYAVFRSCMTPNSALVLAHHEDDQAETFLLHLVRGAGMDGLSAMSSVQSFGEGDLLRPFLSISRESIEAYAHAQQLSWVDDDSNMDVRYSRNFIRRQVIPLLQQKWPAVAHTLSRTAALCQDSKRNLDALGYLDCNALSQSDSLKSLSISNLRHLPRERLLNVIRLWLKQQNVQRPSTLILHRIVDELIGGRQDAMPAVRWGTVSIRRYRDQLYLISPEQVVAQSLGWVDFPNPLFIHSLIGTLQATPSDTGVRCDSTARIEVRFRQGGETLRWHGQTKLLKHLFQEWDIPPWRRKTIPLIYIDDELAMVVGYAISDNFYIHSSKQERCFEVVLK